MQMRPQSPRQFGGASGAIGAPARAARPRRAPRRVDVRKRGGGAASGGAVRRRVRGDWSARARVVAPQIARLRKQGLLKGRGVVSVSTLVTVRQDGRLVIPARTNGAPLTRQAGAN